MNSLFKGIWDHFSATTGSGFYNDIGGRMYLNIAPQESSFPYAVYFSVTDDNDPDFTDDHEDIEIQFNIFTQNNSALEAGQLLESLKTMFDFCALDVAGWSHLNFQRTMTLPNNDFTQIPPIQGYSVMYDVLLERKR